MQTQADTEVTLFVRDRVTGRVVFNSKAIEALGLKPAELAQRGYPLDGEVASLRGDNQDERAASIRMRTRRGRADGGRA